VISHDEFVTRWHALAAAWATLRTTDPDQAGALLERALAEGLPAAAVDGSTAESRQDPSTEDVEECEAALIRLAGAFEVKRYRQANPTIRRSSDDPVLHFCREGWRTVRNPSRDFDVWWYTAEYLDPSDDRVNPLVHYLLVGRSEGLLPLPRRQHRVPTSYPEGHRVRRICLFAAHDVDGVVDDYVVAYLSELSRFADVFYLADGLIAPEELAKLDGIAAGAWSFPHGRYDFGSYSMLARQLVGWDVVETYDELLLANDSCYLLRPLEEVFARMDVATCDWWGLQVTAKRFEDDPQMPASPIPLAEVKEEMLPTSVMDYDDFVHVGSYFLSLRRPVIADHGFRKRLDEVAAQDTKIAVIYKYETGTTQYLIGQGYDFATFIPDLYPYHPVYGPHAFELIREGFPLLKRGFLADNPYDTPDLVDWKKRVLEHVPDAPVEMLERNLVRVSPDHRLKRSFAIRTLPDGTVDRHRAMTGKQFRAEDRATPKFDHWWVFPVCAYDHTFAGNERAVFEEVRDDPSIKKIILTRSRRIEVSGENVVIVPINSPEAQHYVARARHVFVKHGPRINVPWPMSTTAHNVVNLWHGIPLKRFGFAAVEMSDSAREVNVRNNGGSRAVVTSSKMDSLAMAAAMYPASYPDLWPTGLPRNDFIVRDEERLPEDLRGALDRLRAEADGRRIVMFLPTFKDAQADAYYRFTPEQIERLGGWLEHNGAVLAVREHMADRAHTYSRMLAPLAPINLSSRRYPDLEVLYRAADVLISDYSSCLVDFLMTGRPVISFAYDYDDYASKERGLFYDLEKVLPGPVCRTFDELAEALERSFVEPSAEEREVYEWKRRIFFDHLDDGASARVVARVKEWYGGR
jgi:CDP-glycerol glycerophosphotransferase (TagB/SpsB family)